jgi:hypothetical protein
MRPAIGLHSHALEVGPMRLPRIRGVALALFVTLGAASAPAAAQTASTAEQPSLLGSTVKATLLDPTTYAPSAVLYSSMFLDWKSSQPFFANGFVEANPRYTTTGLAHSEPLSYGAGTRQILKDSLVVLPGMIANNALSHLMERRLIESHPEHRKLLRVLGVVQRVSLSALISYRLSSGHFQQWQKNQRLASQFGYR